MDDGSFGKGGRLCTSLSIFVEPGGLVVHTNTADKEPTKKREAAEQEQGFYKNAQKRSRNDDVSAFCIKVKGQ